MVLHQQLDQKDLLTLILNSLFLHAILQCYMTIKIQVFSTFMATIAGIIWARAFLSFENSKSLGPLIKIVIVMTVNLAKFLVLWTMILAFFTFVRYCLCFKKQLSSNLFKML